MTVKEYIQARLKVLRVGFDALTLISASGIDPNIEIKDKKEIDKAFVSVMWDFMLMPDISEDSYSIKFDKEALMAWIRAEADRLGVDLPNPDLKVKDISYLA